MRILSIGGAALDPEAQRPPDQPRRVEPRPAAGQIDAGVGQRKVIHGADVEHMLDRPLGGTRRPRRRGAVE
jgi:hypothetical protein